MVTKKDVLDAYVFLRQHNQSIPDEVLDFIKDASLEKLACLTPAAIAEATAEIEAIWKDEYKNFEGSFMQMPKQLHQELRKRLGDVRYLLELKAFKARNPRPVYQLPKL